MVTASVPSAGGSAARSNNGPGILDEIIRSLVEAGANVSRASILAHATDRGFGEPLASQLAALVEHRLDLDGGAR